MQDVIKVKQQIPNSNSNVSESDTEIVILSDTVRQRRARTPSSSIENNNSEKHLSERYSNEIIKNTEQSANIMPDLLPKTFRLAESSSLFSKISDDNERSETFTSNPGTTINSGIGNMEIPPFDRLDNNHKNHEFSVVEIREKNLMSVENVQYDSTDMTEMLHYPTYPKQGQIVDTINILESCHAFEPEYVETVNIFDASSDTDTAEGGSTPNLNVNDDDGVKELNDEDDDGQTQDDNNELEFELEKELEMISKYEPPVELRTSPAGATGSSSHNILRIEKQRISFEEKRRHSDKERDILKDTETAQVMPVNKHLIKIRPSLRDLLTEERDSFYSSDKENYDEPLIFSEDEDIPRYSIEMATDSDSDTVRDCSNIFFSLSNP